MIEWEVTERGVRVLDNANVEVSVGTTDWRNSDHNGTIPRPIDDEIRGMTSRLEFPPTFVFVNRLDRDETYELGSQTGPLELPDGTHLLNLSMGIKTYVKFEGPATIWKTDDYQVVTVEFPETTRVTLGFRSRHEYPAGKITTPRTPSGLAAALSHLHSSIKSTSPDRSFPTLRGHPPELQVGETFDVPDEIEDRTTYSGLTVVAPESLRSLFVLAPLAYYLQARVRTEERDRPAIETADGEPILTFDSETAVESEAAWLLRLAFFMDCLVRTVGPHGTDLREANLLGELPVDAEWAYDASPVERFQAYLTQPRRRLERAMPDWHLSTYVDPDPSHFPSLPFLLNKLSLIWEPRTRQISSKEIVDHSLDDFYRGGVPNARSQTEGTVASVPVVKPGLRHGRMHAWLAEGIPIDTFKTTDRAFENRVKYLERSSSNIDVTVVLNDGEMDEEHETVARIYRSRAEDLPMSVNVEEYLSTADLARVFENERDFVHYIGHCEEDGLRCTDGFLDLSSLSESNTQTFFLNACGSYYEGMDLVERGSVAGAVTLSKVLNKQAAKVGRTFARLLSYGFCIENAMSLARRRIMTGKDYAVVGDGTHSLTQCDSVFPISLTANEDGDDRYYVESLMAPPAVNGGVYFDYVDRNEKTRLFGNKTESVVDLDGFKTILERADDPVIFEGQFYWPEELRAQLQ